MYKILIYLLTLLITISQIENSYAGSSTANATAGAGDYVYSVITDAGGHFIGRFGLCDGTAAASCATVTAGAVSTSITSALPAGTNVIGHAIIDTGSTTAVTQATASSLNATVVGTGTFAVQAAQSGTWTVQPGNTANTTAWLVTGTGGTFPATQSGTWNITNISGTISLPTLASTSTKQSDGSQKTQIVDGSGNVIASTSNNLNVQCANCSGSGASAADAASFTAGASTFAPAGGQFTTGGATACVTGHQCMVGMTAARAFLSDISSIASTTALTGNGVTGAGSLRVTIASDNTAFSVNAVQSGTWNVNQAGTWNINNISGTVSLPTGASTSALQPTNAAQGSTTSGQTGPLIQAAVTTSAPTYTTAQTSPLSLDTAGNLRVVGTGLAQGSTTSGQTGSMVMGAVTTSAPSYTTAQTSPLSLDTAGNLRVNVVAGGGSGGTSLADAATFTAGTTAGTPVIAQFTSGGATACVTGHACWVGMTAARALLTDVSSVNGTAVSTGSGAVGSGSQRVAVGTDTATIAGSAPGTAGSASTNVVSVQGIASMTPLLANPGTAANWGVVATGAAPPANVNYVGANASGATGGQVAGLISCDNHVFKHITSATDTLAVQGVASQTIRICGWRSRAAGTATWYLENTASTNANCSSTLTQITGVASEVANSGETVLASFWTGLKNTSGNGLCINSTGTGGVDVDIWYTQF